MVHATAVERSRGGRLRVGMRPSRRLSRGLRQSLSRRGGTDSARRAGRAPAASAKLTPNVLDEARGVAFIEAAVKSSRNNGIWTAAGLD